MGQAQNSDSTDQTPDLSATITQALLSTTKPATKLEEISVRKNALIVKGYTQIAAIPGENGASITITAGQVQDMTNQTKEYGLVINVASAQRASSAYVDYDEIDTLVSSLDYLEKTDKNPTQLTNFEAQYRTRGDLWITNYNDSGARMVAIRTTQIEAAGQITSAIAYFRPTSLGDIRQQMINAKQMLDKLRG
jgi:hypothetical protein